MSGNANGDRPRKGLLDRSPVWILHVFIVGLALHNIAMAELYDAGIRGTSLDAVSSWKELLLVAGIALELRQGTLRRRLDRVDLLAAAYAAFVVLYAVIPQSWLDGGATHHGAILALRHDLLPVLAYAFGRGLGLTLADARRLGGTVIATASAVAVFGLIDVYAIPLSWWRGTGAPGWFTHQLGFDYRGLSGLPENFIYNTGDERPFRRLVSTFLSPLATSYLLVVALLLATTWRLRLKAPLRWWVPTVAVLLAALVFTHSRSSLLALILGLCVFAWLRPQWRRFLLGSAVAVVAITAATVAIYPHVAPRTTFTPSELAWQVENAHREGQGKAVEGVQDASTDSHLKSLREGLSTIVHHPQGFGLGNAGSTAARTGAKIKAGESTYTELAVETGLLGGLAFVVWSVALLRRLVRCTAWLAAAFAAILALGLQTDIIGVPWLVFVLWTLAGWRVSDPDL